MRRRSYTVYASSMDEFNTALPNSQPGAPSTQRRKKPTSLGSKRKASVVVGESLWQDFDYVSPNDLVEAGLLPKRKRSRLDSMNIPGNDTETCQIEVAKSLIVKKIMVMGLRGAGKHFLVNSAFHSQDEKDLIPLKQTMDFILKTEAAEGSETKYHFWIRELNDKKFESVVKVYYKIASLFIFVYSVTDRSSFEVLDEAIGSVLKEIPREKFNGVLLANRSDSVRNCEVSHAEGIKLKEKYNLALFMDTSDGEVRERLLEVLNK